MPESQTVLLQMKNEIKADLEMIGVLLIIRVNNKKFLDTIISAMRKDYDAREWGVPWFDEDTGMYCYHVIIPQVEEIQGDFEIGTISEKRELT